MFSACEELETKSDEKGFYCCVLFGSRGIFMSFGEKFCFFSSPFCHPLHNSVELSRDKFDFTSQNVAQERKTSLPCCCCCLNANEFLHSFIEWMDFLGEQSRGSISVCVCVRETI